MDRANQGKRRKDGRTVVKTVFVSVPMAGRTDEDIFHDIRERAFDYADDTGEVTGFVDNLHIPMEVAEEAMKAKRPALVYLSWALRQMANCDDVIFAEGWENARGCQVEKLVYDLYFGKDEVAHNE